MWISEGLCSLQNIAINRGFYMYLYIYVCTNMYIIFMYRYTKRKIMLNVMETYEQIMSMELSVIKHTFLRENLIGELLRKILIDILHFGKC